MTDRVKNPNNSLKNKDKLLREVLINYFQKRPVCNPFLYYEDTNYLGKPCRMPMIILKTRGCSWQLLRGGCTMCGYSGASSKWEDTDEKVVIEQLERNIEEIEKDRPIMIMVTSAGSFFDDAELPNDLRKRILERINKLDFLVSVNTETRAETVLKNRDAISESIGCLQKGGKELCVGIGLESRNNFIRERCIHKGLSLGTYIKAIRLLKELGSYVTTYVLLKPPFLTEKESIVDTINTSKFAFENGSDVVVIMLNNVQNYTLTHRLWTEGKYRTSWLWSAVKVLKSIPDTLRERTTIAGFQAFPKPVQIAHNCTRCDESLIRILIDWNKYRNYSQFKEDIKKIDCECRREWEKEIELDCSGPLKRRVEEGYEYIRDRHG